MLLELDQLQRKTGSTPEQRIQLLQAHLDTVRKRDDLTTEYITLLNLLGRYEEARSMTFGDHIALMKQGKVVQFDAPRELYNHPREVFGGWFLGNPGMNFFQPTVQGKVGGSLITLPLLGKPIETEKSAQELQGMSLGIRPEHLAVSKTQTDDFSVRVPLKQKWIVVGGQYLLTSQVGDTTFRIKVSPAVGREIDGDFYCRAPMEHLMAYDHKGVHFTL